MGGGPRGRNVISTEGNARALHFSPAPTGLRSGQFSRHSSGLGPVLGISLCLYFRHPSISDEKNCRAGGNNRRPCRDCEERLDGV